MADIIRREYRLPLILVAGGFGGPRRRFEPSELRTAVRAPTI